MGRKKKRQDRPSVDDRPFRYVHVRAFSHATEDPDKVAEALAFAAGFDVEDDNDRDAFAACVRRTRSQGHFNNPITILECELSRKRDVARFFDRLMLDRTSVGRLHRERAQRLDDDLMFWLRLDKQAAYERSLRLTQGEDVIMVRAKVATYPKDRSTALAFLDGFLASDPGQPPAMEPS